MIDVGVLKSEHKFLSLIRKRKQGACVGVRGGISHVYYQETCIRGGKKQTMKISWSLKCLNFKPLLVKGFKRRKKRPHTTSEDPKEVGFQIKSLIKV